MAYYAAVVSLKHTIQRLLNSSQISILPPSREVLEFVCKEVISLQEVLQRLAESISSCSERVNSLKEEIREAICKIEDALETHVASQYLSQSESRGDESFSLKLSIDLEKVKQEIHSLTEKAKMMEDECGKEDLVRSNSLAIPSRTYFCGTSKMVGLYDEFSKIKDLLLTDHWWPNLKTVSLVGMAGIGKTALAKVVYEDPLVLDHFDCRAWVTVSADYQLKEILLDLLAQMNYDIDTIHMEEDKDLVVHLYQSLFRRRYLIVLDDVWNTRLWDMLGKYLPDKRNGSRVMLTTRLDEVARCGDRHGDPHQIRFLDKDESWQLLCEKVFGGPFCPPELEIAGKEIAKNCEGLPLMIITVADLLQSSKSKMTPGYWKEAAENKNSLFKDAHEEISKVLLPSYNYLPPHLKACFLYMGVFPLSCEIPASKLIKLWSAEGFLEPKFKNLDDYAMECLEDLVSRSLVLVRQQSSSVGIKTCSLHSAFRHLCVREAWKEKLFHILNSYANSSTHVMESQRRLCIHNNILFGIKEVYDSVGSVSMAHSLLCTGPHHQYPVPICFSLRLLRVLDLLTIRLYKFPIEVLKLVLLRYLALTYNGKLPPSISQLLNLHYLIARRHLSIKFSKDNSLSYLPMEIWDMKELKHLQFMGSNLPDPPSGGDVADLLPNLLALSDVSARSCTKNILERIPNLLKLGIQIELPPDAAEPLCCFDHLPHLHKLESLTCVIMNPNPRSQVVASITTSFPSGLKKLSLSGFGYPWEYMRMIAQLPNLLVLKLRCFAFQGPEWVTNDGEFEQLRFLLIEDTDLEYWEVDGDCFRSLERLIIRHCYKLKEVSWLLEDMCSLKTIELVDCPSAVDSVKQIQGYKFPHVSVHSSWVEGEVIKS